MSLRSLATSDLNVIVTTDFGVNITVTDPAGTSAAVFGYTNDIGQVIDPDT